MFDNGPSGFELAFNHDGFGMLAELADTSMSIEAAERVLVAPLSDSAISVIDWSICSTGVHNCRTRFGRGLDSAFVETTASLCPNVWRSETDLMLARDVARVVSHYNRQGQDLLDIVIAAGHRSGRRVLGGIRLNHGNCLNWLEGVPGRPHANGMRRDFRDRAFHRYLWALCEDLLQRGVDGLSLDFERKAPFFPEDTPAEERFAACTTFLEHVRAMTQKPIVVRVSYQPEKGRPQGQAPEQWLRDGLIDVIIPATHNHEPDMLDWDFDTFLEWAGKSPRPCRVWPQIWPTPVPWSERDGRLHAPEAVIRRVEALRAGGAHGVYFFNFCCFGSRSEYFSMFRELASSEGATHHANGV